jgi:hypothetical protein
VKQQATVSQLKKGMEAVVAFLKERDAKIQSVIDQLEITRVGSQVVKLP